MQQVYSDPHDVAEKSQSNHLSYSGVDSCAEYDKASSFIAELHYLCDTNDTFSVMLHADTDVPCR